MSGDMVVASDIDPIAPWSNANPYKLTPVFAVTGRQRCLTECKTFAQCLYLPTTRLTIAAT